MEELAEVYARSLFEVARSRTSSTTSASSSAQMAEALSENRDLQVFFFSPYFSTEEKVEGLEPDRRRRRRHRPQLPRTARREAPHARALPHPPALRGALAGGRGRRQRPRLCRPLPGADGAVPGRDQRDRQHRGARPRVGARPRDCDQGVRRGACPPGRLPRPQPPRAPVRDRRRGAARDREHLPPDRRRRHRGRRARGEARLRPRRPAAARDGPRALGRPLSLGSSARFRRRTSSSAPSRTRARRRSSTASNARGRRPAPARASSSSSSASQPAAGRAVRGRGGRARSSPSACRCCRRSCSSAAPSALRFMDEKVPGISVPPATIERVERAADPAGGSLRGRRRARRARARAPWRRRPAPDQLPPATPASRASAARLGIPTREEREASGDRHPVAV